MRFTNELSALALAATAAVASLGAQAQSVDVQVIGTITPGACNPILAGGGVIDYGNIPASTLSMTAFNRLPERTVAFSITCNAPTRVAVRTRDNRTASQVPGIVATISPGYTDVFNFGLGTVSGANVGGYIVTMKPGTFTADGATVFTVISVTNGAGSTWLDTNGVVWHSAPILASWSDTLRGQPIAFSSLSGELVVTVVLNRGDALPLGDEVPLDGLATLELVYL